MELQKQTTRDLCALTNLIFLDNSAISIQEYIKSLSLRRLGHIRGVVDQLASFLPVQSSPDLESVKNHTLNGQSIDCGSSVITHRSSTALEIGEENDVGRHNPIKPHASSDS